MNVLIGTGALVRLALRRDRILLPAWLAVFVLMAVSAAAATIELYRPSPTGRNDSGPDRPSQGHHGQSVGWYRIGAVAAAKPTDSTASVGRLMLEAGVRHIVIREDDSVVGLVSIRDVLAVLLGHNGG